MSGQPGKHALNFTKASIEALPLPEKGWKYYYDTKVSGLGIGVGASGVKTFILYRKVNRKPERIKIGRYPDLTVDKARAQAMNLNAEISNGTNPAELKRIRRDEMTFGDLFDQYYKNHSVPHKKTHDEDKQKYDKYLSSNKDGINLASRQLSAITRAEIGQLFTKISKEHKVTSNGVSGTSSTHAKVSASIARTAATVSCSPTNFRSFLKRYWRTRIPPCAIIYWSVC